ncbi:hypothetical protein PCK2_001046 [Pneumocystis canis]|nr:hypothetical protein PCK2_001046 [Pneumocystis canis]
MKRKSTHAGSWYPKIPKVLRNMLDAFLNQKRDMNSTGKVLITPHAGYDYSGPTAGIGYACMDWSNVILMKKDSERIFILGPAHHMDLRKCALSSCTEYETPLGTLVLDTEVASSLEKTGEFIRMSIEADEDEHSIELQLPFICHLLEKLSLQAKIVPILVGSILPRQEQLYGQLFAPYLSDPKNRFIVSSDFCHWGQRFSYTYYAEPDHLPRDLSRSTPPPSLSCPIYLSIERCDREGMRRIEEGSHSAFIEYLLETGNTICGRYVHPISVMLCALEKAEIQEKFQFVHYTQSNWCKTIADSSVSYATAIVSY